MNNKDALGQPRTIDTSSLVGNPPEDIVGSDEWTNLFHGLTTAWEGIAPESH